ncbi:saccharopine dehydrogenase family protein [Streptomyces sp. NPDC098781]|uniref:saccharopine dehydrogenase family protein n=1 Tax=Streptomyces sp. NPDC098781 TaxID=3366097 RepID=UPI00380D3357
MHSKVDFDIVVWGATGYAGRMIASRLLAQDGLVVALGGRNDRALLAVRDSLDPSGGTAVVVADAHDPASLRSMVKRTKAVISTVGPYRLHGSALVEACARAGTDYVDITGEPLWVRDMILKHSDTARASGARVIFSAGFDSIPAELGVQVLQEAAQARWGAPLPTVRASVALEGGGFSAATLASIAAEWEASRADATSQDLYDDPFALTPAFKGPAQPSGHGPLLDERSGQWLATWVMGPINARVVHRSNALRSHVWGEDLTYVEMLTTGPGAEGRAAAEQLSHAMVAVAQGNSGLVGEDPCLTAESGSYVLTLEGSDPSGHKLIATVHGEGSAAYGSTSQIAAETVRCLLTEAANAPGGIWTPGALLDDALVSHLQEHAGLRFAIVGQGAWQAKS